MMTDTITTSIALSSYHPIFFFQRMENRTNILKCPDQRWSQNLQHIIIVQHVIDMKAKKKDIPVRDQNQRRCTHCAHCPLDARDVLVQGWCCYARPSIKDVWPTGGRRVCKDRIRQNMGKGGLDDYGHPKLKSLFVHIFAFNSLERIISDHEHPEIVLDWV